MISTIAAIGAGGALGAILRHGVNVGASGLLGPEYPYGTLGVNILGSMIMGVLVACFAHMGQPSTEIKVFLVTGVLGGFTTFSTFSLDFVTLWERGDMTIATGYLLLSVAGSVSALLCGMILVRWVVS